MQPSRAGVEVYTNAGILELDAASAVSAGTLGTVVDEFVDIVRGERPDGLDVHRGLHLQRLLASAFSQLR